MVIVSRCEYVVSSWVTLCISPMYVVLYIWWKIVCTSSIYSDKCGWICRVKQLVL